jgi:soluble lytic murein transglycosylase-like protein
MSGSTDNYLNQCFSEAGNRFDIDELLIKAIATKESSLIQSSINNAPDGSEAVGIMQIHSQWYSRIEHKFGVTRSELMDDACINISMGAWILSQNFASHGVSWNSVGAYMAGFAKENQQMRDKYSSKVRFFFHRYKLGTRLID